MQPIASQILEVVAELAYGVRFRADPDRRPGAEVCLAEVSDQ